ncbi:type II CRISPR RNA-guided endonuclease Cas9 [uncultured Treponema sp.]|uniref:type II CRISPR RNA-guided endonuclease Cas9 n=1 Tax=uncultured Treponema sp. TaxID=162155 RepID=UPI0025D440F8|nr:type II CRISPR RNA-guided endonuclease Cas9 [uncultured Treponema sp.]
MKYRLGLDLGTNSIGWAVYSLDNQNTPLNLEDMGVRIFSDGRDPKTKEPLAVARRIARGQRKIIYRRKLRRKATFRLLQEQGLFPKTKEETQKLKSLNPYELRIKALDEKLEPSELARVLFNLSVRRGFKSNRKDTENNEQETSNSKEKLSQKDMCTELANAIKDSGCRTIGEFLWKNQNQNHGIRFVPGRMKYYPLRQMYIDEFNAIHSVQEQFFKNIKWDEIYNAIFFQRPLKAQERGRCQYIPENERTFKALPCAQKLRILQEVRNLNYQNAEGKTLPISNVSKLSLFSESGEDTLLKLLDTKEKVTFDAFRKALGLSPACTFNLERGGRTFLQGNTTAVKMRSKNRFGSLWDTLSLEEQDFIVEKLITADEDSEILETLEKYSLTDEQKDSILKLQLQTGTTMLCKEVSEKLVHKMESDSADTYTVAVESLGYKYADQTVEKCDELPYYGKVLVGSTMGSDPSADESKPEKKYGKISNPTVHVSLNQTRVVVNALIKQYGKPAQIALELSRDLKASREAKEAIQKKQNENKKRNEITNKNIRDANPNIPYPNRNDRLKWRLWEELGAEGLPRKCLYCGKNISGGELFSKNIEIEHILPYSRTLLDAESNLTVAHASCNAFKKERSPYEAFGTNPKGFNWEEILMRANQLKNPAKRRRFAVDAMETFEKDSGFIARQLTDNAYLSKMAMKYLKSVCDDIWSVNGGMTKLLRDKWEIDSILKRKIDDREIAHFELKEEQIGEYKKNRYDHRHHALDASVIALIDRSLVKEISTLNARSQNHRIEVPPMAVPRLELQEKVKNIVVSFKPDHGAEGKLSKETLLGKIKREELLEISKIEEADIPLIKSDKVRKDFEEKFAETKDIKQVRKEFKDVYPQIKVFKEYFVVRTAVMSLKENNIEDIVDNKIRTKLQEFIVLHKGEKFEDVLERFSEQTRIKKVRCLNRDQNPIVIKGCVPRYYETKDYCAAIIWKTPPKKEGAKPTFEAQYFLRTEIDKNNKPKKEIIEAWKKQHHPAAKRLPFLLHKDDYLEFCDGGKWYKCRIAGLQAAANRFDIRPIFSVTDCKDWIIATEENQLEGYWKPQKGQNYISVNVLFGEKEARFITVNPIGRVFRK